MKRPDSTTEHEARSQVAHKLERYRIRLESLPVGIQECDTTGTILFSNRAHAAMHAAIPTEIVGSKVWDMLADPRDRESLEHYFESLVRNQPEPTPFFGVDRTFDGRTFDVRVDWDYIRDAQGRLTGFSCLVRDVSREKEIEAMRERALSEARGQLMRHSTISTLGHVAASLAHEFSQPLAALTSLHYSLRQVLEASAPATSTSGLLGAMENELERAASLLERLRRQIRGGAPVPTHANINEVVKNVHHAMSVSFERAGARVSLALHPEIPECAFDPIQIGQVLVNLVKNALEATAGIPEPVIVIGTSRSSRGVEVWVQDSGPGLDPGSRPHLFSPFLTTKPEGLGLGLAICRNIVHAHGGSIDLHDGPAGGCRVTFVLPGPTESGR